MDVSHEYELIKTKFLRLSLLFSGILTLVILGDVLLITLSKENYLPQLIIAIVITILFAWFSVFFFTNIYNETNSQYRYFKGYNSGLQPVEEVEFLSQSEELCYINGLYVYPVYVRYMTNLSAQDKVIFTLKEKLPFMSGDKLTIKTYQRVLMDAERHK